MILFFSGTGNSEYVAEKVAQTINDELISLNDLIKKDSNGELCSEKPLVFVTPTYGWQLPIIVRDYILKTTFKGNNAAYFLLTCGTGTGNASEYAKMLCKEKGFIFMGFNTIVMPENYIAMFSVPNESKSDKIIKNAIPKIKAVTNLIKKSEKLSSEKVTFVGKLMSGPVNTLFYKCFVNAKGFYVNNNCIGCEKCVELCPLNNIKLINYKPKWDNNCTHCMACICHCPTEAIEYKNKTVGKRRYRFIEPK